jgi:hypothetical protein
MLEQKNCPKNTGEICRDFRILAAEKINNHTVKGRYVEAWQIYRALNDGRGLHSQQNLETVLGNKADAISIMQNYKN